MRKTSKFIYGFLLLIATIYILPLHVDATDLEYKSRINTEISGLVESIYPSYNNQGKLDGYLFLVSNYYELIKYDLNDNQVYYIKDESTVDGITTDVVTTADTSYQVKGEMDVIMEVTNDNGDVILKKQYGGNGLEFNAFAFRSYNDSGVNDGYYLVMLSTSTDTTAGPGQVLVKYDLKGNIIFEKNTTEFYNDQFLDSVLLYTNNGKLDSVFHLDDSAGSIARLDLVNETEIFNIAPDYTPYRMNLSYTKDGVVDGIIVIGNDYDNEYLVKYNLSGQEVFRKTISDYEQYSIKSSRLPNGTYDGYVATAISLGNTIGTAVLKYDLNGNLVNENIFDENIYWIDYSINNYTAAGIQAGLIFIARVDEGLLQLKFSYPTYEIVKDSSDEGTISVDDAAIAGDIVKVSVTPKDGYVLKRIVVMDENGKEIEVREDGTFIMPAGKVTVVALYSRLVNPDTASACYVILATIILMSFGTLLATKTKKKNVA